MMWGQIFIGLLCPAALVTGSALIQQYAEDVICEEPDCIRTAKLLVDMIQPDRDPCEDFYDFACGKFLANTIIPDDSSEESITTILTRDVYNRGRILLEGENSEEPQVYKKVKTYYKACMNEEKQEELGVEPLRKILNKLGGYPLLEGSSWKGDGFRWYKYSLAALHEGFVDSAIINVDVDTDYKDSTRRIVTLDEARLGLKGDFLIKGMNNSHVKNYFKKIVASAVLLGADEAQAKEELGEALKFEMNLAEISESKEYRNVPSNRNNKISVKDFEARYSGLHPGLVPSSFHAYFNSFLETGGVSIPKDAIINEISPNFLKRLPDLLKNTNARVIANYLNYRQVDSFLPYLNARARDILQDFTKAEYGQATKRANWKQCLLQSGFNSWSPLRFLAGSMYAKRYFPKSAKAKVKEVLSYVQRAYAKMIEDLDWMDKATKAEALRKLKKVTGNIAYPDELLDMELMTEVHKHLEFNEDAYFKNYLNLKIWAIRRKLAKLYEPVDKDDWEATGIVAWVNAYYSWTENSINFPAGILQGAFFDDDHPNAMNFGGIGGVVGHEYTHGFDNGGKEFDADGNLRNWLTEASENGFRERAKCIIDQYSSITEPITGVTLNGNYSQGEDIADNGGTLEAYYGYELWLKEHGLDSEPRMPGIKYSSRQLFWISYAASWCTAIKPEYLESIIHTDSHSPARYRVNIPLQNSYEFGKDFNCPLGSKMNPEKKCRVW